MLVLSRRIGECILIGDDIKIMLVDTTGPGTARIGVSAPRDVRVVREELVSRASDLTKGRKPD